MTPVPKLASQPVRRLGKAWHRRAGNLHVLKVSGSFYEMGRQHGELLRDAVREGPLPYYRTYLEKILRVSGLGALAGPAAAGVQKLVGGRVARALPEFAVEAISGLADGAGMPRRELLQGCVLPDSMLWIAAKMMKARKVAPAVRHRLALGLGCSSAIAWGDATTDGRMLHARNLDYHGVGNWPRAAAVIFFEPESGQRYVSVGAAGVMLGGVTAMNEAGLTLTVHQHMFSDGTELGGTPIGVVGDIVMREATSFDQAEDILRAHRPIGCWTYLIADGRRRELLCFEENPRHQRAFRFGGDRRETTFGYANIYLDDQLGRTERDVYGSYWRHNLGRQLRLRQLLEQQTGSLDPAAMASILADTGGTECRIRSAIAMLMTVGSVVFRPEDGVLWVASGETPTSHSRFEPFDLSRMDHAPEHGALTDNIPADESARRAFDAYRRSYLAYFDDGDRDRALELAREAVELQPEQPLYYMLAGLLALGSGRAGEALDAFGRALQLGHPDPERVAAAHLWRARAADLYGRRDQAVADYRTVLGMHADPAARKAARRGLGRGYDSGQARRIDIDYAYIDVIAP